MISYKPLLKTMIDKNITKTELRENIQCSPRTFAKIAKNEHISLEVIERICKKLQCKIEDVIEIL